LRRQSSPAKIRRGVTFVLVTFLVAVGSLLQGSIGFGLGVFAVPFLLLIDPRFVPAPLLASAMWLNVLLARREWDHVDRWALKWALSGRVIGVSVAISALAVLPRDALGTLFGTLVLIAVGLSASGLHVSPKRWVLFGAGTLSGFMGTTVSIGGPPMALVYQREAGPKIRGTLAAYFTVGVTISLVGLSMVGRFGTREILLSLQLVPGVLVGFFLSRAAARRLDRGYIRKAVLVVSAAAAVGVILRHL